MRKPEGYDSAEAVDGGFRQPAAGPCILGVVSVCVQPSKQIQGAEVLHLELDIAEGPLKNYYRRLSEKLNKSMFLRFYQGIDGDSTPHFKGIIKAFEDGNNFKFNFDEKQLLHKKIGGNLREEEYMKRDGDIGSNLRIAYLCSIQSVKNGEHKVMAPKKLRAPAGDMNVPVPPDANTDFGPPPETDYNQVPEEEPLPFN